MARKTEDPGLFAERDEHPALRYRETDPETSKEAASQFTKTAAAHREQIIDVLRAARAPMTAGEIGERIGLTNVQVSRRMSDPEVSHRVYTCQPRECRVNGTRMTTYRYDRGD